MKYIVLDLEATCWEKKPKGMQNEIIEIGALAINEQGEVLGEFEEFIRPSINPQLSAFCTQLTSITQAEIDQAETFPSVIRSFWEWIDIQNEAYCLGSWGYYDKNQFEKDCKLHELDTTWLAPHISIKHQYQQLKKLNKPLGMPRALQLEGFALEGTHHRGIDDARNISKIFCQYLGQWKLD